MFNATANVLKNKKFNKQFDKYVHLDLFDFINMINYLGGIDMYITAAETQAMNYPHIWEMNRLTGKAEGYNYLPKKAVLIIWTEYKRLHIHEWDTSAAEILAELNAKEKLLPKWLKR